MMSHNDVHPCLFLLSLMRNKHHCFDYIDYIDDYQNMYESDGPEVHYQSHQKLAFFKDFFKSRNLEQMLIVQASELITMESNYDVSISREDNRILFKLEKKESVKAKETCEHKDFSPFLQGLEFVIRVTKQFPVSGVGLYLHNDTLHPRICDSRDFIPVIFGEEWSHKRKLSDIVKLLPKLQQNMVNRNKNFRVLYKLGTFQKNDLFTFSELKSFASLEIFEDIEEGSELILGVSETHLLIFTKQKDEVLYQRLIVAPLSALTKLNHNPQTGNVELKLVKTFPAIQNKREKLWLYFRFQDSLKFMEVLLKRLLAIQVIDISVELGTLWEQERQLCKMVAGGNRVQEDFAGQNQKASLRFAIEKRKNLEALAGMCNRILEEFSNLDSPYHLIYVKKLQKIYAFLQPETGLQIGVHRTLSSTN